ncbi:TorF family putative porin [Dyella tabacisoli]|uniref:Uncharacterized protein n=1 Tax=Dyella tabacisoli TaxID=2282381 RepID=A0A369UX07_9GAMM|nr:TorF family putative porin [Dyella tabacisoli]RDD82859.1 hypothetical protein DVJ77_04915 [Dyella tabacisoli]
MKRHIFAVAATLIAPFCFDDARAEDIRVEEEPKSSLTGSVGISSDYMFRGLTQSWGRPVIQGGAEWAAPSGLVAGGSVSGVSEHSYPGGSMELDLYASYGRAVNDDWSWRAGVYGYIYPGANLSKAGLSKRSFNTAEANVAVSWKWFTLKYNRSLTDYFGVDTEQGYRSDSRGLGYFQLDASVPLADDWSVDLHAGHTHYNTTLAQPLPSGAVNPDYSDYGATLKYKFAGHWTASVGVTHATNADFYRNTSSFIQANEFRRAGGTRGFVMLQSAF